MFAETIVNHAVPPWAAPPPLGLSPGVLALPATLGRDPEAGERRRNNRARPRGDVLGSGGGLIGSDSLPPAGSPPAPLKPRTRVVPFSKTCASQRDLRSPSHQRKKKKKPGVQCPRDSQKSSATPQVKNTFWFRFGRTGRFPRTSQAEAFSPLDFPDTRKTCSIRRR